MASSSSSLSRSIFRTILLKSSIQKSLNFSYSFCTKTLSSSSSESSDSEAAPNSVGSDSEAAPNSVGSDDDSLTFSAPFPSSESTEKQQRIVFDRPLENGVDIGVYKAILVGQVGQPPIQKKLRSGTTVTLLSLGTGGIRNNRRPLDNEDPKEYANRCAVQWHRVSVYPTRLGELAMKNVDPGSVLYVEGNLETKIFNDPITGLVRRIREVAIRRNGRLVFLGKGSGTQEPLHGGIQRIGYF